MAGWRAPDCRAEQRRPPNVCDGALTLVPSGAGRNALSCAVPEYSGIPFLINIASCGLPGELLFDLSQ
jgi:hypothetical protein